MAACYELKRSGRSGSQFMFNQRAGNNEVVLTSQSYASEAGAEDGIASGEEALTARCAS